MGKTYIKKVNINHNKSRKPENIKSEDSLHKTGTKHLRVCPNCGSTHFRITPTRLSWVFGQKNKCDDCGFIFKQPWTEIEKQKQKKFDRKKKR